MSTDPDDLHPAKIAAREWLREFQARREAAPVTDAERDDEELTRPVGALDLGPGPASGVTRHGSGEPGAMIPR
jgi:hypothetical protein